MEKFTYLSSVDPEYLESVYRSYLQNPDGVDATWRYFFDGLELGYDAHHEVAHLSPSSVSVTDSQKSSSLDLSSEAKVADLINAYRERGHLIANINPLNPAPESHPLLDLKHFGLSESDLDRVFTAGKFLGLGNASLRNILKRLREIYSSSIGVEYTHIKDPEIRGWLVDQMESSGNRETLSKDQRKHILRRLAESETFEQFLHTRYVAQKRFSIEGAEALIPTLDRLIETAGALGADNIVMGMAHRGRLNVLTNTFGKKPEYIFTEFEQEYQYDETMGEGDVKYHMGYSADIETSLGHKLHLSLANNPSHLAFVHPVVEGIARSKQRQNGDTERRRVIPIVIHGDAAFAGQGVVYETLNLSQVEGFFTGGTINIIINNQVGFTTNPEDARSTTYCTDGARMLEVPIFHVNGDDPEALSFAARLSMEFRQKFRKDVFIDLVCYRKYGHNESDEPSFTQPLMYKKIKDHLSPHKTYALKLIQEGIVTREEVDADVQSIIDKLSEAQKKTREEKPRPVVSSYQSVWSKYRRPTDEDLFKVIDTQFPKDRLKKLAEVLAKIPEGFKVNPKIMRMIEGRAQAVASGDGIDWGNAESLAYASLLDEGYLIRITGQDVKRGTFSHRNAVLFDSENGSEHTPLDTVNPGKSDFIIRNSILSETGVLGFEYGWSLGDPNALVIWEAQFGDFANGAQVIIDQFIASGESKWQRASGIVLLLPHGYEGQGPEHSSARLERFLQLCGRANMSVCNFTTPAQLFHALRRQLKRDFRKPLVVMSPKSLLRHPKVNSSLDELASGRFHEVLDDARFAGPKAEKAKRVVLCSGKIYYDLLAAQEEKKIEDVALIRIEQLYPWPEEILCEILNRYKGVKEFYWSQEEPRNMGAWIFVHSFWHGGLRNMVEKVANRPLHYIGRGTGAAPAVGSAKLHAKEQAVLVKQALGLGE